MPTYSTGTATARDSFVFDFDEHRLLERIADLRRATLSDNEVRAKYFAGKGSSKYPDGDTRGWKLPQARARIRSDTSWKKRITLCHYRPFDVRPLYYVPWMVDWPRPEVMCHMLSSNLGLITSRMTKGESFAHVQVTKRICEVICMSPKTSNNGFLFPLYLEPNLHSVHSKSKRAVNMTSSFTDSIAAGLHLSWIDHGRGDLTADGTFGPEDVLHWMYAQLHSQAYRERYAEFLKTDFPRIFLTTNLSLFRSLCKLGADLVALHLLESDTLSDYIMTFPISADNAVTKVAEKGKTLANVENGKGRLFINRTQYFDGVPEEVWNSHIGSYQVCYKWLYDRKKAGRKLSDEDIEHYHKIVVALNETIKIMKQIDETINTHGGWPIK